MVEPGGRGAEGSGNCPAGLGDGRPSGAGAWRRGAWRARHPPAPGSERPGSRRWWRPASPIASVPTGTPAGICTIDSRLSWPDSALLATGTAEHGQRVVSAAVMPGRCAAPPAPAIITLQATRLGAFGVSVEALGRAMRGDHLGLVGDAQLLEDVGGALHGLPVGHAAHDNADLGLSSHMLVLAPAPSHRSEQLKRRRVALASVDAQDWAKLAGGQARGRGRQAASRDDVGQQLVLPAPVIWSFRASLRFSAA